MKISRKLTIGFVGIALFGGLISVFVICQERGLLNLARRGLYESVFLMQKAWQMMEALEHQEIAAKHYIFFGMDEKEYLEAKENSKSAYYDLKTHVQKRADGFNERLLFLAENFYTNLQKYQLVIEKAFSFSGYEDKSVIREKDKEADVYLKIAHEEAMVPIIEHITDSQVKPAMEKIISEIRETIVIVAAISICALLFALCIGFLISRTVYLPIKKLEKAASKIGRGNLNAEIDFSFKKDEIGSLAEYFKRMAVNLKETMVSRNYIDNILNTSGDAIRVIDSDFNVIMMNKAMRNLLGREERRFEKIKCYEQFSGPFCRTEGCTLKRILNGEKRVEVETYKVIKGAGGEDEKMVIRLMATPLVENNKIIGIVESIQNISERKKMEESLRGNLEKLEKMHKSLKSTQEQLIRSEKLASIGRLAAGVAHEINNPIGFIKSNLEIFGEYAERLAETMKNQEGFKNDYKYITTDIKNMLKETAEGVDRIIKIVSELKTFSKKDEGIKTAADLNEVMEGVLKIIRNEIKYKAELKKEYGRIPSVECDRQQVEQVFMNILLNAVQAIEEKGSIAIRTYVKDKYVYAEISDTGRGISEEIKDKIFDPFFTTKRGIGTGLGLSISYDIMKKHNGDIKVESVPDKGTKFLVSFPI